MDTEKCLSLKRTCACFKWILHLDVLKWARGNGCDWDSNTFTYTALNEHLDVLKWARDSLIIFGNDCPWNSWNLCIYHFKWILHLEVLKWARQSSCPWDSSTCSYTALNGFYI